MKEDTKEEHFMVLLLYPDSISAALGSPGFRQVYRTLLLTDNITVGWGWYDEKNERVVFEYQKWKRRYNCIAFSVPFEPLYTNVVRSLAALNV